MLRRACSRTNTRNAETSAQPTAERAALTLSSDNLAASTAAARRTRRCRLASALRNASKAAVSSRRFPAASSISPRNDHQVSSTRARRKRASASRIPCCRQPFSSQQLRCLHHLYRAWPTQEQSSTVDTDRTRPCTPPPPQTDEMQ